MQGVSTDEVLYADLFDGIIPRVPDLRCFNRAESLWDVEFWDVGAYVGTRRQQFWCGNEKVFSKTSNEAIISEIPENQPERNCFWDYF
jgi:hypothetical protein